MDSFLFVTGDVVFQETTPKGAILEITALELNKESQQVVPTEYRIEEGEQIAASLVGNPIYYGTKASGKHLKGRPSVGEVLKAWKTGNKIKAKILITSKSLIKKLKKGIKFLFSVGGVAEFAEVIQRGKRIVKRMVNALCNHLQIVDVGTKVGFPNAKVERVIEINETVLFVEVDPIDSSIESAIESAITKSIPFLVT